MYPIYLWARPSRYICNTIQNLKSFLLSLSPSYLPSPVSSIATLPCMLWPGYLNFILFLDYDSSLLLLTWCVPWSLYAYGCFILYHFILSQDNLILLILSLPQTAMCSWLCFLQLQHNHIFYCNSLIALLTIWYFTNDLVVYFGLVFSSWKA